jgi:hypothetical protein
MTTVWKPTKAEIAVIKRAAASESAPSVPLAKLLLEPGERRNLDDASIPPSINIALVSKTGDDGNDTDLHTHVEWTDFTKGVPLTKDGRAIVDFYITDVTRDAGLCGNVTVHYEDGRIKRIIGSGSTCWFAVT